MRHTGQCLFQPSLSTLLPSESVPRDRGVFSLRVYVEIREDRAFSPWAIYSLLPSSLEPAASLKFYDTALH